MKDIAKKLAKITLSRRHFLYAAGATAGTFALENIPGAGMLSPQDAHAIEEEDYVLHSRRGVFYDSDLSGDNYELNLNDGSVARRRRGRLVWRIDENSRGRKRLNQAVSLVSDEQGVVFIVDCGNHRIVMVGRDGRLAGVLGGKGNKPRHLRYPRDVALWDGRIYVADTMGHRVAVYRKDGELVDAFGALGTGRKHLNGPGSVAVAANGTLFVLDSGNTRVKAYSPSGEVLDIFTGKGDGQLRSARYIQAGPDGNLYIADPLNRRVAVFAPSGQQLRTITPRRHKGEYVHPLYLSFRRDGKLVISAYVSKPSEV